jgi:hypothetical protein
MKRIGGLVFFLILVVFVGHIQVLVGAQGLSIRSVGVRLMLSWGDPPLWWGAEITSTVSETLLSASLFVTARGRTLFMTYVDVPVAPHGDIFARLTGGFYHIEGEQPLPYPLIGAGLSSQALSGRSVHVNLSGEFIYPLAFPVPAFSVSGGWLF